MNNKKITIIFILVSFAILIGIGITFAYFTSSTDFENEFTTGLFQTEATETFTSPQNWLPGDTTSKELTIANTGNVDVKARVCIEENWESENGDTLPLEQNGNRAAIINLANTSDWTYRLGCYEYNNILEPNDETTSFIQSVTFNPNIEADITCITNGNTKTCTSSGDGYDNATYTLTFTVETVQASAANKLWSSIQFVNRQNNNSITVGDEISIDTEHFYVVSSDSNKTVLLSKYNLLVGDVFDVDFTHYTYIKTLSDDDSGYGLQNSTARGWIDSEENETIAHYIGVVGFSGTNYWDNSVCERTGTNWNCTESGGLLSEYSQNGESYLDSPYPYVYRSNLGNNVAPNIVYDPTYAYGYLQNNGYTISYYVEQYISTLMSLGAPSTITGRLLSYEEANTIINGNASPLKENLSNMTYWLGSASHEYDVWFLNYLGDIFQSTVTTDQSQGVRPVIEIPTSELN